MSHHDELMKYVEANPDKCKIEENVTRNIYVRDGDKIKQEERLCTVITINPEGSSIVIKA